MILGIVGGLSPEVTSELYLRLIGKSRSFGTSYPHIIIDSIPLEFTIEDEMIIHSKNHHRLLPFLKEAVQKLQDTDLIVIPCNTAHIFIEELRNQSKVPIVSTVEEVIKELRLRGYRKVCILATSNAAKSGIYACKGIEFVYPSQDDQKEIGRIIVKAIRNSITGPEKLKLQRIARNLRKECGTVVLACTDLRRVLKGDYIDSFDVLVEAVFEKIGGDEGDENA